MNIIIIGITGVGKTTIGKLIAELINQEFIDLDKNIEKRCGVSISTIFEIEGEEKFRERETFELREVLTTCDNYVLSLGGGAILSKINRNLVTSSNAVVIQLYADVATLVDRLSKSIQKRPLFNDQNIAEKVTKLYDTRRELYNEITDLYLDTSGMKQSQVVEELEKILQKYHKIG